MVIFQGITKTLKTIDFDNSKIEHVNIIIIIPEASLCLVLI